MAWSLFDSLSQSGKIFACFFVIEAMRRKFIVTVLSCCLCKCPVNASDVDKWQFSQRFVMRSRTKIRYVTSMTCNVYLACKKNYAHWEEVLGGRMCAVLNADTKVPHLHLCSDQLNRKIHCKYSHKVRWNKILSQIIIFNVRFVACRGLDILLILLFGRREHNAWVYVLAFGLLHGAEDNMGLRHTL